jgi:glycine/D-amino acid oxidase-like deaminating enzyme
MLPQLAPVETDTVLPKKVDVVVIGGGIIGASTALYLAQRGVSVAICEKGEFGAEQSSRNWGWVRKMGRDPREFDLAIKSADLWAELDALTGENTGFRRCGITYFAETQQAMDGYARWLEFAKPAGIDSRMLNSEEIKAFAPGATRSWLGGMHTPSDAMAEPSLATSAIVAGARKFGAKAFRQCAVRGVEQTNGRISAVVTEKGRIECSSAVLAGGGWSSLFAGNLGLRLPQLKFLANISWTAPIENGPDACGSGPGFGFRRRYDGGYNISMRSAHPVDIVPDSFRYYFDFRQALKHEKKAMRLRIGKRSFDELFMARRWKMDQVSPFEKNRILHPEPAHDILDQAIVNIGELFPALKNIKVLGKLGGLVDTTPDALPVISEVDTIPGFYISTGFSGHGFGVATGAGHLVADMITGAKPIFDPQPFRFSRFTDGSKIEHWPIGF